MRPEAIPPRPSVAAMHGYAWEESSQALAERFGLDPSDVVRFDLNTVPWQPAISGGLSAPLNEYPDASYRDLVAAIAGYCAQRPESIVVGAGADELITLVAQAYLDSGRRFAVSNPTYPLFSIASRIAGASPITVESGADLTVDLGGLASAARQAEVTWLANPDNPTGQLLDQDGVRDLAVNAAGLLVIDEAYGEFVDSSALDWIASAPNVAVIRTLSKAFGLAGIRVGYLIASPDVVAAVNIVRPVSSIAVTSADVATQALQRVGEMRERVRLLVAERARLATELSRSGRRIVEGRANFVLADVEAAEAADAMSRGLVVRTFATGHRLSGCARITVRSRNENDRLITALARRN